MYVLSHPLDINVGGQWFSGNMLDWRLRVCGFEPHLPHTASLRLTFVLEQETLILALIVLGHKREVIIMSCLIYIVKYCRGVFIGPNEGTNNQAQTTQAIMTRPKRLMLETTQVPNR